MKPRFSGLVVLVASLGLGSCSGDPTDSFRGEAVDIVADPTSLFVVRGQTKQVIVEVVDEQGNPLQEDLTLSGGSGLTIVEDTTYLRTSTASSQLRYERAYNVTANELVSTSFTLSGGGQTREVAVRVVPATTDVPLVTVASTGPNASDPTVLTVPAPYLFYPDSGVTFSAGPGIVIDRSADGRSITVLPHPGTASTGTATVAVDYIPTVPLATTTDVPLTISPTVPALPGTGDPATAPEIAIPAPGASGGFFDGGSFGATTCGGNTGAPCQLYRFTLAEDATIDAQLNWSNTADLGLYIMTADGTADTGEFCDEHGNAADAQPEHCELSLAAGTYLAGIVSYGPFYDPADPNPDWVSLRLTTIAP